MDVIQSVMLRVPRLVVIETTLSAASLIVIEGAKRIIVYNIALELGKHKSITAEIFLHPHLINEIIPPGASFNTSFLSNPIIFEGERIATLGVLAGITFLLVYSLHPLLDKVKNRH